VFWGCEAEPATYFGRALFSITPIRSKQKHRTVALTALRVVVFAIAPIVCIAIYVQVSYSMADNWYSELLAFAMPGVLLVNFTLLIAALLFPHRIAHLIMPLTAMLAAEKPMKETFALNFRHQAETSDLRVMSYNVASFNPGRMADRRGDTLTSTRIFQWLRETDLPDILCIQEFYHGEQDDYDQALDSIVAAGGYTYYYLNPDYVDEYRGIFGVVTFFRKRPIRSGRIPYYNGPVNKGTFHDFMVGNDTVRLLNIHLTSMSIRLEHNDTLSTWDNAMANVRSILPKLKQGHESRREELDCVMEFVMKSPHRVLLCADLNALPYSETYQRLLQHLNNSFEKVGLGMGITYHQFPFYVRIDNMFHSAGLRPQYFTTHKDFKASDHYPIEAGFSIEPRH